MRTTVLPTRRRRLGLLSLTLPLAAAAVAARTLPSDARPLPPAFTEQELARHAAELAKRLPGPGFTVLVEPPFIVVGDEAAADVRGRAVDTVRWAVSKLKRELFEKDPADIIDIWLFKDRESYETNVKKLTGEAPQTKYGFYLPSHRALFMNIATGGGTLVHEIVHPILRADFPACPPWLDEGLGSLYEQCRERDGRIVGLPNWRLAGLKDAIKAGTLPTFEKLTSLDRAGFYAVGRGDNYAQARYLCYYLQEKDLLVTFYKAFRKDHEKDPSGYETLTKTLGEKDMADFQKRWTELVLKLRYDG